MFWIMIIGLFALNERLNEEKHLNYGRHLWTMFDWFKLDECNDDWNDFKTYWLRLGLMLKVHEIEIVL